MFGEFLFQYRVKNGMTQSELAKKLSVSQNAVSQYESGKRMPTVKRISSVASALGCSVADIIVRSEIDKSVQVIPTMDGETGHPRA